MYRIEITIEASADADAAHAWMAEHISPTFEDKWYRDLFERIQTLGFPPIRRPVAAESHKFPEEIRELLRGKRPKEAGLSDSLHHPRGRGVDPVCLPRFAGRALGS